VKQQCARLLQAGFLARTPWARLQHFPRYLKAAALRLDKLRTEPARDAQRMAELLPLEQAWKRELAQRARQGGPAGMAAELEQFGWLLEELRVSLFAQELKTPVPVSPKRLAKLWHSMRK
jgi:ATP-dependent helicase HrpA